MGGKGHFDIDLKDDVTRGSIVLNNGEMMWPPPPPPTPPPAPAKRKEIVKPPEMSPWQGKLLETSMTAGEWQAGKSSLLPMEVEKYITGNICN